MPAAVVDVYARRHGTLELARQLVDFLRTPEAQRAYAEHGLRPILPSVEAELEGRFPPVEDLFTIRDLGGWDDALRRIFADGGVYDRAIATSREGRR